MKRSGFKRPEYAPPPPTPLRPLERAPNYGTKPWSGGGRPKESRVEIPWLILMGRRPQQYCLLRVPGVCPGFAPRNDCCACHSNSAKHGKGMGMKAHDFYTVRGCARCHSYIDTSMRATGEERQSAWDAAFERQIIEWRMLAVSGSTPKKDRDAIELALWHLKDRRYVA